MNDILIWFGCTVCYSYSSLLFICYHYDSGMILQPVFTGWTSLLCWSALVTVLAVVAGASLVLGSSTGSQRMMPWNGSRSNMRVWSSTSLRISQVNRHGRFWLRLLCRPVFFTIIIFLFPVLGELGIMFSGTKSVNFLLLYIFSAVSADIWIMVVIFRQLVFLW